MGIVFRYLVLKGRHEVRRGDGSTRIFRPGDIFESKADYHENGLTLEPL